MAEKTPGEIRNETLRELRAMRSTMHALEWDLALDGQPEAVQIKAALERLNVGKAILALENAALVEIRDALKENETALLQGIASLADKKGNLKKIKDTLTVLDKVLTTLAKVLEFARILP